MKKSMSLGFVMLALFAALALGTAGCATGGGAAGDGTTGKTAPAGSRYFCNCGPDCTCGSSSAEPGNCSCGTPMVRKKIFAQDEANYYTCGCADCTCNATHPRNASQCSCGKPLKAFPKR